MKDEKIILTNIIMATSYFSRLLGLMGKKRIDYGMCFMNCNSIHTFFMRTKIDVIMLDKEGKILYLYEQLKPNRIILPKKKVSSTIELPRLTIQKLKLKKGCYVSLLDK